MSCDDNWTNWNQPSRHLFRAVNDSDTKKLAELLAAKDGALGVNDRDNDGCGLIHLACLRYRGTYDSSIIKLLLKSGADIDLRERDTKVPRLELVLHDATCRHGKAIHLHFAAARSPKGP